MSHVKIVDLSFERTNLSINESNFEQNGEYLKNLLPEKCRRSVVTSPTKCTGSFTLILDRSGDCKLIVGSNDINDYITPELVSSFQNNKK